MLRLPWYFFLWRSSVTQVGLSLSCAYRKFIYLEASAKWLMWINKMKLLSNPHAHRSLTSFVSSPAVRLLRLTVAVVHTVQHDQRKWEQAKLHLGGCMIVPTQGRKRQRYSPRAFKVRIWGFNMYIFPQRSRELRSPDSVVSHIEKTPFLTTG